MKNSSPTEQSYFILGDIKTNELNNLTGYYTIDVLKP